MKRIHFHVSILALFLGNLLNAQTITTIAGTGNPGYNGDGMAATIANFNGTPGIALDNSGNLVIVDWQNNRIRKVNSIGFVSTIVGTGASGYNGDNIAGISASLKMPSAVTYDQVGNLYIVDGYNARIRKMDIYGVITTIAGTGVLGYNGDNIPATSAQVNYPTDGIIVDNSGNIYFSDSQNNRVRKISSNGIISTIAGTGVAGYNGDGIAATAAHLNKPYGLAFDATGNLYVADGLNHRIRKISTTGFISTVAGTGTPNFNGDNILANSADLNTPEGVTFDGRGNLYIADYLNNRIRKVDVNTNIITTIAGNGTVGYNGDNIPATLARLYAPVSTVIDNSGNLLIADFGNNRVRKVSNAAIILPLSIVKFTAQLQNGSGLLQWQTNNEVNMKQFIVEGSTDSRNFTILDYVKAKNIAGNNTYSFIDTRLKKGINYYRLKIVDRDGKASFSSIVSLRFGSDAFNISLAPNPIKDIANLSFSSPEAGKYAVDITDVNGRIINQVSGRAVLGQNNLTLELSQLITGTYFTTIRIGNKVVGQAKFIKE